MIRFVLIQNVQGKTRMAKYYVPYEDAEKHKIEYEVHRIVSNRNTKFANCVEVSDCLFLFFFFLFLPIEASKQPQGRPFTNAFIAFFASLPSVSCFVVPHVQACLS